MRSISPVWHVPVRRVPVRPLAAVAALLATCTLSGLAGASPPLPAGGAVEVSPAGLATPLRGAATTTAVADAVEGLQWVAFDMHLHTDHSSDGGIFHQQQEDQRNQDTFLGEQRDQALRTGMDVVAFTDHRIFDQHHDPDYDLDRAGPLRDGLTGAGALLVTGEEWGGGRHGTAFGIRERLEHGPTERVGCGLAEMTLEAAAQDALLGIAHPGDGGADGCVADLVGFPLSHVEAVRGGDGLLQEPGLLPEAAGSSSDWYARYVAAGGRAAAVNGSDNHFKQVWAGPSGPGGSAAHLLVAERSEAGVVEAIRAGRTMGGWGRTAVRATTLLDADRDGAFEALTGGWSAPTGEVVTVAVRVEQGSGHTVQVWDDAGRLAAEAAIALPDETVSFELPASSSSYRVTASTVALARVGMPEPLDYVDTLVLSSTPVWTTAPPAAPVGAPAAVAGEAVRLGGGDWSGFADLAVDGADEGDEAVVHAVYEQRDGVVATVRYRRSADGGRTWSDPVVLAEDGRSPTVAVAGDRVVVAWQRIDGRRFGGPVEVVAASAGDAAPTFASVTTVDGNAARPALAAGPDVAHLVWQQQVADGTWAIHHLRVGDGMPQRVSTAEPWSGGLTRVAVPPREILHIPASVEPAIAVDGDRVAIAWEDNRQDQTPGRSGSPDDWGIFGAVSADGGRTFGEDERWTPRRVRRDDVADPEGVVGNPALSADLAFASDGTLHLAFTDTFESAGFTDVWAQTSADGGGSWGTPVRLAPAGEWAYRPMLAVDADGVSVLWQQATDPTWSLVQVPDEPAATSSTAAGTPPFGPVEPVTAGGRYAGWPSVADDLVAYTAETPTGFAVHVAPRPAR